MSAWGSGPFENDDAADWLSEMEEESSLESIEEAFSEIARPEQAGYVEIPEGSIAVAAAEVLAQLLGNVGTAPIVKGEILDEDVFSALAQAIQRRSAAARRRLVERALVAVDRVFNDAENSELRQVQEESESGMSAWVSAMQDLLRRLRASTES